MAERNTRIALVTDGIMPYVVGGMQKHSYYLAKYFAKQQVYVDLFHYNHSNLDIAALDVFSEEEKKYITGYVVDFPPPGRLPGHYVRESYRYSEAIFERIKDKLPTYDFIYTKGFAGWKLISEKHCGRINCCPIGVKFHGYEMYQVAPDLKIKLQHLLLRPFVKKLSRQADKVFSYGGKITGLIRQLGVPEKNIIVLPSGIENSYISSEASPNNEPVKFVFIGRYERRKGIEELNKAIMSLSLKQPVHISFIGPVPGDKKIERESVTYYGEIRNATEINRILKQHDVLICPSWSEGFPNVILEAMAAGLAIIATDVGAVSSLVGSDNGVLIEPHNQASLEQAIIAMQNETGLQSMKQSSLQKIRHSFNWDQIIIKLIDAISHPA